MKLCSSMLYYWFAGMPASCVASLLGWGLVAGQLSLRIYRSLITPAKFLVVCGL